MTESEYTSGVVQFLRDHGHLTFKHCDRFTPAIPDVSTTGDGRTTWFEMKVLRKREEFYARVMEDPDQFFNMLALSRMGRARYAIVSCQETFLIDPGYLFDMKIAGTKGDGYIRERVATVLYSTTKVFKFPRTDYLPFLNFTRAT